MILSNEILYFDAAIDIIFILDILIGFCTAYMKDDGKLENSFPKIWKNYFKGYFALDFIASIPISLLLLIFQTLTEILRANKFLRLMRIPKLLRIYRTYRQIRDMAKHMESLKHDEEKTDFSPADVAAAYVAFASKYTGILPLENKHQKTKFRWKAFNVLAHKLKLPEAYLELIMNVALNKTENVRDNLIDLVAKKCFHKYTPEENIVRGIISLATGDVDSIEDIAQAVNFDEDIAEGLAFVAASVTINVTLSQFVTSSSLNKICSRCGLPLGVIASLLAIVNQDYKHGEDIDNAISLIKIDGRYLKSIMAIYSDENPNGKKFKREAIRNTIQPLAMIYNARDVEVAMSIIRIIQGDVHVMQTIIKERLCWGIDKAATATAFVLLAQANKVPLDFSPSEHADWDETRDATVACRKVATALTKYYDDKIDPKTIMFLLNATYRKGDSDKALKEMQEECKKNGNAILDINKVHAILCSLVPGNSNNSTENIEKEITKDQQSDKAKLLTGIQRMEKMKNIKIRTILNLLRLLLHGEYKFKTNNTTENTTFIHEL